MLIDFFLQRPPIFFAFAADINTESQIVIVVVVARPHHAAIAFLLKSLRRNFHFRWFWNVRRRWSGWSRWIVGRRNSKLERHGCAHSAYRSHETLHANSGALNNHTVNYRRDIFRQIRQVHPRNIRRSAAIGFARKPLSTAQIAPAGTSLCLRPAFEYGPAQSLQFSPAARYFPIEHKKTLCPTRLRSRPTTSACPTAKKSWRRMLRIHTSHLFPARAQARILSRIRGAT